MYRQQRRQGQGPRGVDGVGIMSGGEIVNTRTHSAPEIREGEELIATAAGSVGFAITQFNINPANATTFPWLSKIAQLFERYEFQQLSFHFGHDVSGFATQGQTGLVYQSALYDAAAAAPTSASQIEATDPFVPCMPNENSCLRLDKKSMHPSNEPKYCLQGNPPGATDIKTYNVGSYFFSSSGQANATEVGKIRVKYKVHLFDRILDSSQAAAPANYSVSNFTSVGGGEPINTATGLQLAMPTVITNGLNAVNTAGSIVLPAGNYNVDGWCELQVGTAMSIFACSIAVGGVMQGNASQFLIAAASACNRMTLSINPFFYQSTGANALTLSVSAATAFTGGAGVAIGAIRITAV
jgi:hypothetical protein